jgi:hypothetical protein
MWNPDNSLLATTEELQNLFFIIDYTSETPETVAIVTVTANQQFEGNLDTTENIISGYYSGSFLNNNINYLTKTGKYVDVKSFNRVDLSNLKEVISFTADTSNQQEYTYTAVAKDVLGNVLDSKEYSIVVTNNWTTGKNALQELVRLSKIV